MDFNSIGSQRKPFNIPGHLSQHDSDNGSIESEDPLAREAPTRSHTQSPVKQDANHSSTPGRQTRIAVVLTKSPGHWDSFQEVNVTDDDLDGPVISDLTPRGRPRTLFTTLSAPSPSTAVSSDTTSNPPAARGRGRPKGSFKKRDGQLTAAASRQARTVKPRPHLNGFPKRRGRPPKNPSPPPMSAYYKVDAPFFAFLCEWNGCKAELHNLETLRRHVYIVHGDSIQCLWGKCGRREEPYEFDDDESFREHVEEAHLVPLSWHVGDGPNNTGCKKETEDEVPDYLKDENGDQVTPSIRNQQEEDIMTWRKNRRKLKELLIRMNENLPDDPDEEIIDDDGA